MNFCSDGSRGSRNRDRKHGSFQPNAPPLPETLT